MVTSVEPQATRIGVQILEQGGNAVDAAVATAYALAVTHPSAASIGGGGFMLVSEGRRVHAIDFRETAPVRLPRAAFDSMIARGGIGPSAVGVPGTVAGLSAAHDRFGRLPRSAVMAPAIDLARNGYLLSPRQHLSLTWNWRFLRDNPAFEKAFMNPRSKKPWPAGSKLTRPRLAESLGRLATEGPSAFYSGTLGEALVSDLAGALITPQDLAKYRARFREPLSFRYRGLHVVTMPPPSAGGVALAQTLGMLEAHRAHEYPADSVTALHLLVEAAKRAHAERRFHVVDPDTLTHVELERRVQRWLDPKSLVLDHPIDLSRATPSSRIHPLFESREEPEHTTHFSVVDRAGMAVSCTITLSAAFGAKLLSESTGIVLNNSVASFSVAGENLPVGGRRTTSSMAPTLVFDKNQLVLVLGSPGGDTIPNTITQVLRNVVDYGMTIDRAIEAPRIHHGFIPDEIRFEAERPISQRLRRSLARLGHHFGRRRLSIGDANNILIQGGVAYGFADAREGGLALAAPPGSLHHPVQTPESRK